MMQWIFLLAGILSAGLGIEGFLLPAGFIDGGVTGVSMLGALLTGVSLPVLIALINAPFVAVAFYAVSRQFGIRSLIAIAGLSLALVFVPFPSVTSDTLLAAVFGGMFLGAGIGLAIRGGGVLDGTEVMALLLSRRTGINVGNIILGFNIVIFVVAMLLLGVHVALYSILTYFAASKTIDYVLLGIEEYTGVMINSPKSDEIKQKIFETLGRGVTVFRGYGGYKGEDQHILMCVVTKLEIMRLYRLIRSVDNTAFVVSYPINDVHGGVVKRRAFH